VVVLARTLRALAFAIYYELCCSFVVVVELVVRFSEQKECAGCLQLYACESALCLPRLHTRSSVRRFRLAPSLVGRRAGGEEERNIRGRTDGRTDGRTGRQPEDTKLRRGADL